MTKAQRMMCTTTASWPRSRYKRLQAFLEVVLPPSVLVSQQEMDQIIENTIILIDGLHTPLKQGYLIGLLLLEILGWFQSGKRFCLLSVSKRHAQVTRLIGARFMPISQLYGFMAGLALVDFYSLPRVWETLGYHPYQGEHENVDSRKVMNDDI